MPSRLRSCLLGVLVFGCACRPHSWPMRPQLRLVRPAPPVAAERCEPAPEPGPPTGRTPPPTAEGALALVDLRGDDRLAVVGGFSTGWSPDGERVYTVTRTAVLAWGTRSGALEASWPLAAPVSSAQQVLVSPDGTSIGIGGFTRAPGDSDSAPMVWLIRTGEHPVVTTFPGVEGALHISADGRRMVAAGHAWDLTTGEHRTTPTPPYSHFSLSWMPDGLRAVVITRQPAREGNVYTAVLWDAVTGREIHRFPRVGTPAAVSADGERVALLHGSLDVFSTRTFERVAHLTDIPDRASVSLSPDGRRAVVETGHCPIHISMFPGCPSPWLEPWDPGRSFPEPAAPCDDHSAWQRCPPPSLDLWDVDRAVRLARTNRGAGDGWAFNGDGRFLTQSEWPEFQEIIRVDGLAPVALGDRVRSVSPDGRFALYENGPTLALAILDGPPRPTFERPARVIARSPDGTRSAALDADGRLRVEGPSSCVRLSLVAIGRNALHPPGTERFDPARDSVAFSDDGATLVALTNGYDSQPRVRALDSRTGAERWSMQAADGTAAAFLTAGTVLVQGSDHREVQRYDASTGALLGTGRPPRLSYATPALGRTTGGVLHYNYDYDGAGDLLRGLARAVATADGSRVGTMGWFAEATLFSRWNLAHPERVVDVRVGDEIDRIAVSRDGVWAVALQSGGVRLYRADDEQPVEVDALHRGSVTALAFSAAGDRLFSAGGDGTLAVTAVATGRVSGRARFPMDGVTSLWVSPDGSALRVETRRGMRARFRCE